MADQALEGMLSPFLRRQMIDMVRPYLKGTVLDVGCGSGMLAEEVSAESFVGVEVDSLSLNTAIEKFPTYRFQKTLPEDTEKFDTVVSLAVIEHVTSPEEFLAEISSRLKINDKARVVITTPHPSMDWIHDLGANIGLFSKHANDEHEELLDYEKLVLVGKKSGLKLVEYKRFLFGSNQLAVFKR